jgi:hypothetical protein
MSTSSMEGLLVSTSRIVDSSFRLWDLHGTYSEENRMLKSSTVLNSQITV